MMLYREQSQKYKSTCRLYRDNENKSIKFSVNIEKRYNFKILF